MDITKQVLSIEQMQHLNKLGLELGETMCYWARLTDYNPKSQERYGKWILVIGNNQQHVGLTGWEFVPAYTLQDILEKLPNRIEIEDDEFDLNIRFYNNSVGMFYSSNVAIRVFFFESTLFESAYEMLCWCIEQGFVRTNKEVEQ